MVGHLALIATLSLRSLHNSRKEKEKSLADDFLPVRTDTQTSMPSGPAFMYSSQPVTCDFVTQLNTLM